jgi:hypothetical protein
VTSRFWRSTGSGAVAAAPEGAPTSTDRNLAIVAIVVLLLQLVLGVRLRHLGAGVWLHVGLAMGVAALFTTLGARALGRSGRFPFLRASGGVLLGVGWLQVLLGMAALVAVGIRGGEGAPPLVEVAFATAHQTVGAVLLGAVVVHALASGRLGARRGVA